MSRALEATSRDVERLDDIQLTDLLRRLLLLEVRRLGVPSSNVSVGMKIDIPDGGEDGHLEWSSGPDPRQSNWIPARLNAFQVKATTMGPTDCGNEVKKDEKQLKPRIHDVVSRRGTYVLVYGRSCNRNMELERVDKIRKSFGECGIPRPEEIEIKVYGAESIANWANEYLSAAAFVLECAGRASSGEWQSWQAWAEEHAQSLRYTTDAKRDGIVAALREHLSREKSIARMVGLSGLGKTRLALELFRPPSDPNNDPTQAALSASVVYCPNGASFDTELLTALREWNRAGVRGAVVVDECPLDLHKTLQRIVVGGSSRLSLLTLDFDPDSEPGDRSTRFVRLEPIEQDRLQAMLADSSLALPEEHLKRIAAFAEGYPLMAELLVGAAKADDVRLWKVGDPDLVRRLLERRQGPGELAIEVVRALAIFEHLGVEQAVRSQLEFFVEKVLGTGDIERVYSIIRSFESVRIVDRRGDYVRVTPLPLAVRLAGEWWDRCSSTRARQLLATELPDELVGALTQQLRRLKGHGWVQKLVAEVCEAGSPFSTRDLLDSARGSRVVSSLAEVNPRAVCGALARAFRNLAVDDLRSVRAGRRDLVWCLEKLCWWPETFDSAADLLLGFAAAENESWGNNATHQVQQLFHIFLSGTELPAIERLPVLDRALASGDASRMNVAVDALCAGLENTHFTRMGGVESQGDGLARSDWAPRTWGEVHAYWGECLRRLSPVVARRDALGARARAGVAARARGMVTAGALDLVSDVVEQTRSAGSEHWPEMLSALREVLVYEGKSLEPEVLRRVGELIASLEPQTLEGQLDTFVSRPSWSELRREPDGSVVQVAQERARGFGERHADAFDTLVPVLTRVLRGEQRQGFTFGDALARSSHDPARWIEEMLIALDSVPVEERNAIVFTGVVSGLASRDRAAAEAVLEKLARDEERRWLLVDATRAAGPSAGAIERIRRLVEADALPPAALAGFAYGSVLRDAPSDVVATLADTLIAKGASGAAVALDLLVMYSLGREPDQATLGALRRVILVPGLLAVSLGAGGLVSHHFEATALMLLKRDDTSGEFRTALVAEILGALVGDRAAADSRTLHSLILGLFASHFEAAWPQVRVALSARDARAYRLRHILSRHWTPTIGKEVDVPITPSGSMVPMAALEQWCSEDPEAPPIAAAICAPSRSPIEGERYPRWTPAAVMLLDRFGERRDVLGSLSVNVHTGGWVGSAVPRLVRRVEAFRELVSHPLQAVRNWALEEVDQLEREIVDERKRDEERTIGIYR